MMIPCNCFTCAQDRRKAAASAQGFHEMGTNAFVSRSKAPSQEYMNGYADGEKFGIELGKTGLAYAPQNITTVKNMLDRKFAEGKAVGIAEGRDGAAVEYAFKSVADKNKAHNEGYIKGFAAGQSDQKAASTETAFTLGVAEGKAVGAAEERQKHNDKPTTHYHVFAPKGDDLGLIAISMFTPETIRQMIMDRFKLTPISR